MRTIKGANRFLAHGKDIDTFLREVRIAGDQVVYLIYICDCQTWLSATGGSLFLSQEFDSRTYEELLAGLNKNLLTKKQTAIRHSGDQL